MSMGGLVWRGRIFVLRWVSLFEHRRWEIGMREGAHSWRCWLDNGRKSRLENWDHGRIRLLSQLGIRGGLRSFSTWPLVLATLRQRRKLDIPLKFLSLMRLLLMDSHILLKADGNCFDNKGKKYLLMCSTWSSSAVIRTFIVGSRQIRTHFCAADYISIWPIQNGIIPLHLAEPVLFYALLTLKQYICQLRAKDPLLASHEA